MRSSFSLRAVLALGVAGVLLVPGAAAQVATQDSVTTSGSVTAGPSSNVQIDATSGPSGENPSGQASFLAFAEIPIHGPVTCLAVNGNSAIIKIQSNGFGLVTMLVNDGPDTFDAFPFSSAPPSDCSPVPPGGLGGVVSSGDITVVDTPSLPTSTDQCKDGGWRNFPDFRNQGQCVAFVLKARLCEFLERLGHHPKFCRARGAAF